MRPKCWPGSIDISVLCSNPVAWSVQGAAAQDLPQPPSTLPLPKRSPVSRSIAATIRNPSLTQISLEPVRPAIQ